MEHILSGRAAAADLQAKLKERVLTLQAGGIVPTLATVRVGEDGADASYERAIVRVCQNVGIRLQKYVLPLGCGQAALEDQLRRLDRDPETSGILLFRPLPKALDEAAAAACIRPGKDVDCMTEAALAGVYLGTSGSWAPCTAEGCMRLLAHYGVDPAGMHAVVLGRSAVVGRPQQNQGPCRRLPQRGSAGRRPRKRTFCRPGIHQARRRRAGRRRALERRSRKNDRRRGL